MSTWILGSSALQKVEIVQGAFRKNRINQANFILGFDIPHYHPALCCEKIYTALNKSDLDKLFDGQGASLLNFSENHLQFLNSVYTASKEIDLVHPSTEHHLIHTDILRFEANAQNEFADALSIIQNVCGGWLSDMMNLVVAEILPIKSASGDTRYLGGFSDYNAIGAIFISLMPQPSAVIELAVSLVHELGHQVFMLYQAGQNPIPTKYKYSKVYSGIRKTERPILGSLHAVVALMYMLYFLNDLRLKDDPMINCERSYINDSFNTYLTDLKNGIEAFDNMLLNPIGNRVLAEARSLVRLYSNE